MQYFKGDDTEVKFYESGKPILDLLSSAKDEFFDQAYACFALGELLYDLNLSPLANAIERNIFRESFSVIFEAFTLAGSFESYLTVFRNIFGDDVVVEFTVPAPGKLEINIEAQGVQLYDIMVRRIVGGAYVLDELVDEVNDNIVARLPKGFQTEYEVMQMLYEMVPDGVFTTVSLTIA